MCEKCDNVDAARRMLKGVRCGLWGTSNCMLDKAARELKQALHKEGGGLNTCAT